MAFLPGSGFHAGGVPREKTFCRVAFTSQGLRAPDARESPARQVPFAPVEVAFSPAYRPGFSSYPEAETFREIHAALAVRRMPGWISAEGTNVSPTSLPVVDALNKIDAKSLPGEPTVESYLARLFNHGAVLANVSRKSTRISLAWPSCSTNHWIEKTGTRGGAISVISMMTARPCAISTAHDRAGISFPRSWRTRPPRAGI